MESSQSKDNKLSQPSSIIQKLYLFENKHTYIPYFYAFFGSITFVLLQINMKIVCRYLNPIHALSIRRFFLFMLNYSIILYNQQEVSVKNRSTYTILLKRMILGGFTVALELGPLAYIPASLINTIFNTGPIIVCFVQSYFYKKSLNKYHLLLTVACFIGITFIIRPDFIFENSAVSDLKGKQIFMLCSLTAAVTYSFSMIYLHELKKSINSTLALHYFFISQCLFNIFVLNFTNVDISQVYFDSLFYFCMAGLVISSFVTQNFMTKAMMMKKPSYIMPFGYVSIVCSVFSDAWIFGASFDILTIRIIGMFLTSCVWLISQVNNS